MTIELQESARTLAEIVDFAATGEDVLVMRDGKAVARVVAVYEPAPLVNGRRRLGFLQGMGYTVPDDFDEMGREEIEKMFYGEE